MATHGKRYEAALAAVDREQLYDPEDALALVKEQATAAFDETVEVAINLGVDPRHADQVVRGAVTLPNGTGQEITVMAFAQGESADEAEGAGADHVGTDEYFERIEEDGWLDFDVAVATPDVMGDVSRLGRILGPRGLMPNPKSGTVSEDIGEAVREIKRGKVEYRTERNGIVQVPIGKDSFSVEELAANLAALVAVLQQQRPDAAKGHYLQSVIVSSSMGPGVKINPQHYRD